MVGVTLPRAANLSDITIDTDLAMGAHNITLGAGQTTDGKDVGEMQKGVVGDLICAEHVTEVSGTELGYTKKYEFVVPFACTLRVAWEMKRQTTYTAYARIYKNGVAYGDPETAVTESYVAKTADLAFAKGDLCQIYAHGTSGFHYYIQKMKLSLGAGGFLTVFNQNLP